MFEHPGDIHRSLLLIKRFFEFFNSGCHTYAIVRLRCSTNLLSWFTAEISTRVTTLVWQNVGHLARLGPYDTNLRQYRTYFVPGWPSCHKASLAQCVHVREYMQTPIISTRKHFGYSVQHQDDKPASQPCTSSTCFMNVHYVKGVGTGHKPRTY